MVIVAWEWVVGEYNWAGKTCVGVVRHLGVSGCVGAVGHVRGSFD